MLPTGFHIVDRNISMEYRKRKLQYKSFGVQRAISFSQFCEDVWLL